MRTSTYEILLPLMDGSEKIKDRALLVNGLYGAYDVVTKTEAEKISAGDFGALPLALRERLLRRGHLTQKSEAEELADMKMLGRLHRMIQGRAVAGLTIMPTYDCNFRCPYCYEQHRLKKGQAWLEHTMSQEMAGAVFAALKDYQQHGCIIKECTLYGGEPLLAKNTTIVRKILAHCRAMGLEINVITNGYDLEAHLDSLSEYGCDWLQISLDGVGDMNNRRRIHKDGLPTYGRILQNIELALQRGIGILLRVNVGRENFSHLEALVEDLRARGLIEKEEQRAAEEQKLRESQGEGKNRRGKFSYYFRAVTDDRNPENNVTGQMIMEELLRIGFAPGEAMEHQLQYISLAETLRSLFRKEEMPDYSPAFCGAEQGMFVVDPFGSIYPCWNVVALDKAEVGFTDVETRKFMLNLAKAKWRTRTSDLMTACQSCPYVFICRGGCACHAFREHGSYFREHCGESRETFNFIAPRIAGEVWMKSRENELSLSLAEPLSRLSKAQREKLQTSSSSKEISEIAKAAGLL